MRMEHRHQEWCSRVFVSTAPSLVAATILFWAPGAAANWTHFINGCTRICLQERRRKQGSISQKRSCLSRSTTPHGTNTGPGFISMGRCLQLMYRDRLKKLLFTGSQWASLQPFSIQTFIVFDKEKTTMPRKTRCGSSTIACGLWARIK